MIFFSVIFYFFDGNNKSFLFNESANENTFKNTQRKFIAK